MVKPLIAANWKMYKTVNEALQYLSAFKPLVQSATDVDIALCPPFTALAHVGHELQESNIRMGAQNMFYEREGAFTGEISPMMLRELGCVYVILGHSERRRYFMEPGMMINKKLKMALRAGLHPILCVGESEFERTEQETENVINTQLTDALEGIPSEEVAGLTIAYEPVWAIGTGKTATPEMAQDVHLFIRSFIAQKYGKSSAKELRIIYGGSVNADNIKQLISKPDINGALVGNAGLDPQSFAKIVRFKE